MRDIGRYFMSQLGGEQHQQQYRSRDDAYGPLQHEAGVFSNILRSRLHSQGADRTLSDASSGKLLPPFTIDHGRYEHHGHYDRQGHHYGHADLDSRKSIADLIGEGKFRRYGRQHAGDHRQSDALLMEPLESFQRRAERPPSVNVMFGDANRAAGDDRSNANFEIGKYGRVTVLRDPELNHLREIRIHLDREAGQLCPTPRQQYSLNQLLTYLGERLRRQFGAACDGGIRLDDQQGLSGGDGRRVQNRNFARQERFHPETEEQIHRMNRFDGAGHGRLSHREVDDYFSRRTVPKQQGESRSVMAAKEAMSALFNPDRRAPYDTVRQGLSGGLEIGRYGLTAEHLQGWLAKHIGSPPEWQRLQGVAQDGRLPRAYAEQFQNPYFMGEFLGFVENLKTGHRPVSALDMRRLMPRELQESVMTDLVGDYARKCRGNMGAIALSYRLGRNSDQLSAADLNDPHNQNYARTALRLYGLAQSRQMSQGDSEIEYICNRAELGNRLSDGRYSDRRRSNRESESISENGYTTERSQLGHRLVAQAVKTAHQMNSIGWCARGVKRTLRHFGVDGIEGHAADTKEFFDRDRRFKRVDLNDLQPGDIVVRGRSRGHRYGHVLVYLGNGMEASDHVQRLSKASKYGGSWAYRMVST